MPFQPTDRPQRMERTEMKHHCQREDGTYNCPTWDDCHHRGACLAAPLPALPDGAEVLRAWGEAKCLTCGQRLDVHPKYAYPWQGYCHKLCNGTFVHC